MNKQPQPVDTPDILYKYRYFDEKGHHLKILTKNELWFTPANKFNDPFDSALVFCYDDNPKGIMRLWVEKEVKQYYPTKCIGEMEKLVDKFLKKISRDKHIESAKREYVRKNYDKFGMCSLTPNRSSLLMWSHYANKHEGFCIGFDTKKLSELQEKLALEDKLLDLQKIICSNNVPQKNFFQTMLSDVDKQNNDIIDLLITKSNDWSYEDEYRLIYWYNINTSLNLLKDTIKEIILGVRISDENKEKIIRIVTENNRNCKIYQAIKSEEYFELIFQEIKF